MRLARDYEHAEGRDLRGFIAFAATQDLAEAREGEAALESDGLDAVRLMTIHRAKGLEFPVVCVADLGRLGVANRPRLLLGRDGDVGLRLAALGGGDPVPALAYDRLAAEEDRADAEEERRLFYVAMTRARERLILSGGTDCEKWPEPRPGRRAARTGSPAPWPATRRARRSRPTERRAERSSAPGTAASPRVRCRLNVPATLPPDALAHRAALAQRRARHPPAGRAEVMPAPPVRPRPAPQRLSYSSLQDYARCGYRFYLQRVLGLPPEEPPPLPRRTDEPAAEALGRRACAARSSTRCWRSSTSPRPPRPAPDRVRAAGRRLGRRGHAGRRRGRRRAGRRLRRLAAVRPPRRRPPRPPRGRLRLRAGARGRRPAGQRLRRRARRRGRRRRARRRLQERPARTAPTRRRSSSATTPSSAPSTRSPRCADGAPRVDVAHCFLERPDAPVVGSFAARDVPALAERVLALARGVLEQRYPVTATPHRDLCAECPGRRALCSHPESRTLAPVPTTRPPAPWRAAAARRSPRQVRRAPQVDHRVQLRAEQQHDVRQPQPDEQDHGAGERAVGAPSRS